MIGLKEFVFVQRIRLEPKFNIEVRKVGVRTVWQVDPKRESPQEELKKLVMIGKITCEDVFEVEKSWSGRYLLIVNDWIYLDTAGSLGVYIVNVFSITEDDFLKKLVYDWYYYVCNVLVNLEISIWNKIYWDLRGDVFN